MMSKPNSKLEIECVCPDCGHNRFQVHDRGTYLYDPETETARLIPDEVALLCLKCLHVTTEAVVIEKALPKG